MEFKIISDEIKIELANRFGIIDTQLIDSESHKNIFKLGNKIQKIHY